MKHLQIFLLVIFVFSVCLRSQDYLNIKKTDGVTRYASVSQIKKLTFNVDGNVLSLYLASGSTSSDSIKSIAKIYFDTVGSGSVLSLALLPDKMPTKFDLSQNFPNPFNPSTTIKFAVPVKGFVNLRVYDVLGNLVETLINEEKPAGQFSVIFDARKIASGIYFYKLSVGSGSLSKKMILIK